MMDLERVEPDQRSTLWRRFPGRWRLQVHVLNPAGAAFWARCIRELALGTVHAEEVVQEDGRRVHYTFEIG